MHLERTGDTTEVREVYSVTVCAGCQEPLAYPRVKLGWLGCTCVGTSGHRTFWCFDCRTTSYDPPHDETRVMLVGGVGYFGS